MSYTQLPLATLDLKRQRTSGTDLATASARLMWTDCTGKRDARLGATPFLPVECFEHRFVKSFAAYRLLGRPSTDQESILTFGEALAETKSMRRDHYGIPVTLFTRGRQFGKKGEQDAPRAPLPFPSTYKHD